MNKLLAGIVLTLVCTSCTQQQYIVSDIQARRYPIQADNNASSDPKAHELVSKYKHLLDKEMGQVVGESLQDMTYGRPESLLTNLTSDVMLGYVRSALNTKCDLALMNVNGHRANLAKGNITIGNIFEIYSFENSLAILKLKGKDLLEVFDSYANLGGAGISSSAKLIIQDKKIIDATIDGAPIDKNKIYTIVTLDYLADGNDGMEALKNAVSNTETGIILRDVMIDYIQKETAKGKKLSSALDGRITIKK